MRIICFGFSEWGGLLFGWDQIRQVIINTRKDKLEMRCVTLYLGSEFMTLITLQLKREEKEVLKLA